MQDEPCVRPETPIYLVMGHISTAMTATAASYQLVALLEGPGSYRHRAGLDLLLFATASESFCAMFLVVESVDEETYALWRRERFAHAVSISATFVLALCATLAVLYRDAKIKMRRGESEDAEDPFLEPFIASSL